MIADSRSTGSKGICTYRSSWVKNEACVVPGVTLGHARSSDVVANFCFESPESLSVHLPSFEALKVDLAFPSKKCSGTNFVQIQSRRSISLSAAQLTISRPPCHLSLQPRVSESPVSTHQLDTSSPPFQASPSSPHHSSRTSWLTKNRPIIPFHHR